MIARSSIARYPPLIDIAKFFGLFFFYTRDEKDPILIILGTSESLFFLLSFRFDPLPLLIKISNKKKILRSIRVRYREKGEGRGGNIEMPSPYR